LIQICLSSIEQVVDQVAFVHCVMLAVNLPLSPFPWFITFELRFRCRRELSRYVGCYALSLVQGIFLCSFCLFCIICVYYYLFCFVLQFGCVVVWCSRALSEATDSIIKMLKRRNLHLDHEHLTCDHHN
jgi:hypothetical protein